MIRARVGAAATVGAALLLAMVNATGASAATAPVAIGSNEIQRSVEPGSVSAYVSSTTNASHLPAGYVPSASSLPVTSSSDAKTVITGLNMRDQRLADNGNQFSLEPPDQGLCVGGNLVLESVNTVFRIHNTATGTSSDPISLNQFFTGYSGINRTTGEFGQFLSDPKCYVDPASGRFFMSLLEIDQDASGNFTGRTATYLAVSKTRTPSVSPSDWWFYTIDTTDDGTPDTSGVGIGGTRPVGANLPDNPECPCLGDQPLIGADRYGFYVTTNEFSLFGSAFNGAQIYALDKSGLESGKFTMQSFHGAPIALAEGPAYSLQPATSPTVWDWSGDSRGTAFFLSALDFNGTTDNRIAEWRLTNTSSLASRYPKVVLQSPTIIGTQVYGQPPAIDQKAGPTPLADYLATATGKPVPENQLESNDDRMNQVVLQGGHLFGAVNTIVKGDGPKRTGIAWFAVTASRARLLNQGYVSVKGQSVFFPSIAIGPSGRGVMTFSLSGPDYYPSSAYLRMSLSGTSGPVQVMGAGAAPADGFTGYQPYGGSGVERWGDYSAAVPDYRTGDIWVAAEDIPGTFGWGFSDGNYLANWGTTIAKVSVGSSFH